MSNEELIRLYQEGNSNLLEEIIENNIGIIKKIAIKYNGINRELELDDLIQEGILGLIRAAKKYDFNNEKKAKFITYAVYYINRYINSSVNGGTSKEIENNKFYHQCTSLNKPVGEDDEKEIIDFVEGIDYSFENIEEKIFIDNLRKELEGIMQEYNTLEQREVLKLRYGWNSKSMTLNEVAEVFNITREKVRITESTALRKLRNSKWTKNNIREFVELGYIDKYYLDIFKSWGMDI